MKPLRVLLVDDHAPFRRLLGDFLRSHGDIEVVGEACNGLEAVEQTQQLNPDLVLMDLSMPGLSGFDATRLIKERCPGIKVVILSSHVGEVYRKAAVDSAADGYIEKNSMKTALLSLLGNGSEPSVRLAV